MTMVLSTAVTAAETVIIVTEGSGGWTEDDTRPTGDVRFTEDYGDPDSATDGSVELTTGFADNDAKAGLYNHSMFGTPLTDVETLSYWTYQAVGTTNPPHADASYQLQVDLNGDEPGGFTTLVFEPYWNPLQDAIVPGVWQDWEVDLGLFWSSQTFVDLTNPTCATVAGAGGPPFYTLAQIQADCPDAVVEGIGFNVGTYNPGYTVAVDLMQFNETIWDFELTNEPEDADDCKDDGWMTLTDDEGDSFKNQGQCIKYAKGAGNDGGDGGNGGGDAGIGTEAV